MARAPTTAMLEGVVLNLLRNFPAAELFVAERPGSRTNLWGLAQVRRQAIPKPIFPCEGILTNARYFWRYDESWRAAIRNWFPLALGSAVSAKTIRVGGVPETNLDEFCA